MAIARIWALAGMLAVGFAGSASALEAERADARTGIDEGLLLSSGSAGGGLREPFGLPMIDSHWPDRPFLNLADGFSYTLSPVEGFRFVPVARQRLGADDRGPAELGILAQYKVGSWRVDFGARRDLAEGHQGTLMELGVKYAWRMGADWRMAIGPDLSWNLDRSRRTPFGLELGGIGGQRSYRPDSDLGLNLSVSYLFTPRWTLTGFAGYKQSLAEGEGSILDGPGGEAGQASVGLSIGFSF